MKYIGVYFKNSDIFVTNQGFFDSEQFYKILGETELTYDKWKEKYLNGVAFDRWSFPEASGENIIYTQSLPISSAGNINEYFLLYSREKHLKR